MKQIYTYLLCILTIILAFYVFQLMITIATDLGNEPLLARTTNIARVYILIMLVLSILQPFTMNLYGDVLLGFTLVAGLLSLIMDIILLVLLCKFRMQESTS